MLSKIIENERVRLRATFFNNLSVGLLLTGFLIPYLSVAQNVGLSVMWLIQDRSFTFEATSKITGTIIAMLMAFTGCVQFRKAADRAISKIQE